MQIEIADLSNKVSGTLQNNGVVFAGLFGSQAKGTATTTSDYDFLIEFSPQKKYTLFHLVTLKEELEKKLHGPVDVVTPNGLDHYIKQEVLDSIVPIYDNR